MSHTIFDSILEILEGITSPVDVDFDEVLTVLQAHGVDIAHFTPSEIMEAIHDAAEGSGIDLGQAGCQKVGIIDGHAGNNGDLHSTDVSFCGIYSDTEIAKFKSDVSVCESEVSSLRSDVHHHENLVSLSDTARGHSSGDYDIEVRRLGEKKSALEKAISTLRDAKARLSNAQ